MGTPTPSSHEIPTRSPSVLVAAQPPAACRRRRWPSAKPPGPREQDRALQQWPVLAFRSSLHSCNASSDFGRCRNMGSRPLLVRALVCERHRELDCEAAVAVLANERTGPAVGCGSHCGVCGTHARGLPRLRRTAGPGRPAFHIVVFEP